MWGFIRGVFKYWEPLELEGDISHVRVRLLQNALFRSDESRVSLFTTLTS